MNAGATAGSSCAVLTHQFAAQLRLVQPLDSNCSNSALICLSKLSSIRNALCCCGPKIQFVIVSELSASRNPWG